MLPRENEQIDRIGFLRFSGGPQPESGLWTMTSAPMWMTSRVCGEPLTSWGSAVVMGLIETDSGSSFPPSSMEVRRIHCED